MACGRVLLLFVSTYYGPDGFWMERIVNVHYVDKATFMNGKTFNNEEVMSTIPSYEEVLEQIWIVLNWMGLAKLNY